MAIYTQQHEHTSVVTVPNQRSTLYAVVDDEAHRVIAWCANPQDAEYVKASLVYYGDKLETARLPRPKPETEE